jgi:hypothetical protein
MKEPTLLDCDGRIGRLERRLTMTEATVVELEGAVGTLTTAFNTFATDTNTTIADLIAKEAAGGTITAADLGPIKDSIDALAQDVDAADVAVKGEDPGKDTAEPTSETISVTIDSTGEGSAQIDAELSRVTITQQPTSGTASLTGAVEVSPPATKITVVNASPESTAIVVVSIAAA